MRDILSIYSNWPYGILNAVFGRYAAAVPTNVMKPISIKLIACLSVLAVGQIQLAGATEKVDYSPIPAVDCVINPFRVVDISSPVAGVIEQVFVERSQAVSSGQVIAQLESSVERANVDLARYRAGVESEIELGRVNINFDKLRKKTNPDPGGRKQYFPGKRRPDRARSAAFPVETQAGPRTRGNSPARAAQGRGPAGPEIDRLPFRRFCSGYL